MKAITIIAGLAGTVAASHVQKHARHHARDTASTWSDWDPAMAATTTTTTSSVSSTAWPEWETTSSTTTTPTSAVDPWATGNSTSTTTTTSASSWGAWDPSTSVAATTTAWDAEGDEAVCAQAVIYITGEPTWGPDAATTSVLTTTSYMTVTVSPTAPVPLYTQWTATGTYTIPESTITVETTITVPAPTSAALTSGWNTYGGVTTTVTDSTTITCPYASLSTEGTTVTPVLATTVFTCPYGGVYTIAPSSVSVSVSTITVYPVPATYAPGTWTQSATTVTVTDTDTVFVCPFTTPTWAATTWSAPTWSAASTTASSSTWSASPSASPSVSSGKLGSSANGNTWAMTYSPYTSSGGCKDAGTVASDIADIAGKGFTTIRVYSTDCSTLENVGSAARTNNLKLILGVFISATGISGAQGQVTDIVSWAQWDLVELVVIGNEAVFNGYCSASALAGFVSSVKDELAGAGYTGPCSTTEPIETWLSSGSAFCGVVDVVAANLYAFFNAQTTADQAGPFIQAEIAELEGICPGKDVFVMETGWPHSGDCNGAACPSSENQATAINSIKSIVGAQVVFFSYEDDAWKEPGQFNVEQYWGCADVFSGN